MNKAATAKEKVVMDEQTTLKEFFKRFQAYNKKYSPRSFLGTAIFVFDDGSGHLVNSCDEIVAEFNNLDGLLLELTKG